MADKTSSSNGSKSSGAKKTRAKTPKAKKTRTGGGAKKAKKKTAAKKAELKTKPTGESVAEFLAAVPNETRRKDAKTVDRLMRKATGKRPKLWGSSIVGYGAWTYSYASGRSGDWFEVGFAPRKANLVLYLLHCGADFSDHLARLGKHKAGKGCLYLGSLANVDLDVLADMIELAVATRRQE